MLVDTEHIQVWSVTVTTKGRDKSLKVSLCLIGINWYPFKQDWCNSGCYLIPIVTTKKVTKEYTGQEIGMELDGALEKSIKPKKR